MLHKVKNVRCIYLFFSDCGNLSMRNHTWPTHSKGLRLWVFLFNVVTQKCHINVAFGGKSVFYFFKVKPAEFSSDRAFHHSLVLGRVACHFG